MTIASDSPDGWFYSAICLNHRGTPHVAYEAGLNVTGDVMLARLFANGWRAESVETRGNLLGRPYCAVDRSGSVHLLYGLVNAEAQNGLRYSRRDGAGWVTEMVRATGQASSTDQDGKAVALPENFSMALGRDELVRVGHVDPTSHMMRYGRWAPGPASFEWEPVEYVGPPELSVRRIYPSLATAAQGSVFLTYKKYQQQKNGTKIELRLATRVESEWKLETVAEDLGSIDGISHVAVDTHARAHVVWARAKPTRTYGLLPDMQIVYASREDDKWLTEVVHTIPSHDRGSFLFRLGRKNVPRIVFSSLERGKPGQEIGALRLASKIKGQWVQETIVDGGVSRSFDVAVDRNNTMHVVYAGPKDERGDRIVLKYARHRLPE